MSQVEKEIREQPEALGRLLKERARERGANRRPRSRAYAPRFVVIAARGSSDNAARYAQYLFGAHNRLPVCLATPVALHLLRGGAVARGRARRRREPVGAVARHRGRGRVGPEAGRPDPRHHQPPRLAALPRGGAHAAAPRGRGAGGGRHQDVHQPALRARHAERGARGRGGALGRALPRPRPRGAGDRPQRRGGREGRPVPLRRALRGRGARLQLLDRLRGGPQDEGDELPRGRALLARGPAARAHGDDRPRLPRPAGGPLRPRPLRHRRARRPARAAERGDRRDLRRPRASSAGRASPCPSPRGCPSGSRRWSRSSPGRSGPSLSRARAGSTPTSPAG